MNASETIVPESTVQSAAGMTHPADATDEWERRTVVSRSMLYQVQDLVDRHGESWANFLPAELSAEPHAVLLRMAEEFEAAGAEIAREVSRWGRWHAEQAHG